MQPQPHPEVRFIRALDFPTWQAFEGYTPANPRDDFGRFEIEVSRPGTADAALFQVVVATAQALPRAAPDGRFKGVILPAFGAAAIKRKLTAMVADASCNGWDDVVRQLERSMCRSQITTISDKSIAA